MNNPTINFLNIMRVSEILIISFCLYGAIASLYYFITGYNYYLSWFWGTELSFATRYLQVIFPFLEFGNVCDAFICLSRDYFWVKATLVIEVFYFIIMNFIEYCVFGKCTFHSKVFFHEDDYK